MKKKRVKVSKTKLSKSLKKKVKKSPFIWDMTFAKAVAGAKISLSDHPNY